MSENFLQEQTLAIRRNQLLAALRTTTSDIEGGLLVREVDADYAVGGDEWVVLRAEAFGNRSCPRPDAAVVPPHHRFWRELSRHVAQRCDGLRLDQAVLGLSPFLGIDPVREELLSWWISIAPSQSATSSSRLVDLFSSADRLGLDALRGVAKFASAGWQRSILRSALRAFPNNRVGEAPLLSALASAVYVDRVLPAVLRDSDEFDRREMVELVLKAAISLAPIGSSTDGHLHMRFVEGVTTALSFDDVIDAEELASLDPEILQGIQSIGTVWARRLADVLEGGAK